MADNYIYKTRDFIQLFDELLRNTETEQSKEGLSIAAQRASSYLEEDLLHIEILCFGYTKETGLNEWFDKNKPDETIDLFSSFGQEYFMNSEGCKINFKNIDPNGFPNQLIGTPNAPALLIFLDPKAISLEDFEMCFNKFGENKAFVIMVSPERSDMLADFRKIVSNQSSKLIPVYLDKAVKNNQQLIDDLNSLDLKTLVQLSKSSAVSQSLEKIIDSYNLFVEQTERELAAQQILAQQQNNMLQANNSSVGKDAYKDLKLRIEKYFHNFETGIKNKFEEACKYEIGVFWQSMENLIAEIDYLHKATQGKKTVLTIPEEYQQTILTEMQDFFQRNFTADLMTMNDLFEIIEKDIQKEISKIGAGYLPINFKHMSADIINNILTSQIRFSQPYFGEIAKMGPYQYFVAIRQYQMIFVMVFSTFGLASIRRLTQVMIPASIVLLGVGGYFVVKSVQKERKNSEAKEIEKAQKAMQGIYAKIYNDAVRTWVSKLTDHLKTEMKDVMRTVENHVSSYLDNQKDQQKSQQQLAKRQVKSLEEREKSLKNYLKEGENIKRNIRRFRSEIRTELNKTLKDFS